MAAGLGFKTFNTGDVLSAADVNGYLMQGILVFASATARDAAITSPQEGQFAFLKDTNVTTYYTGSAWANVDTTGMTNPMTTTGDVIYSSSGSTPARLGIGTAGQVLRVNSGATAPEWAAPAGGGKVLQVVVSANATSFQSIKTASATDVTGMSVSITPSSATSKILITGMLNGINNQSTGTNAELVELDLVDGSNVKIFRTNAGQCLPFAYPQMNVPFTYLHSPATTSALTYKLRVTNNTSTYGIYVNNGNSDPTSSMVAMEIGA
jgi:hypothetical protein